MDGACVGDGGDSFHVEDVIQTSNSVIFSFLLFCCVYICTKLYLTKFLCLYVHPFHDQVD
jgi:hypothetical protein